MANGFFASFLLCFFIVLTASIVVSLEEESAEKEYVLTLDHSNFTETIGKHDFIVVEFYAPWCGHCKNLAPEYEKAASILSSYDPPIILAKVDANEESNKELSNQFDISGFPSLKILKNAGKNVQDYKGPREADGIVEYLKKQAGPASAEIKSPEDAGSLIDETKIFVVGVFPKFSGEEFENFMSLAEKLRSDYDFGHTLDAKYLPRGELSIKKPTVRLFKPFDELFVDFEDFQVDAMEKFVLEGSVPIVTIFNQDPSNHPYVVKFFESPDAKAMLFVNFSGEFADAFKSNYKDVAALHKAKGVSFLLGDLESSDAAFQYFGLQQDQAPLILVQTNDGKKFLKSNLEPNQIAPWLKEYMDGKVEPFIKSEPIPENNSEPVKVVVADSLQDMVFNSGKNILLEFYAPWCGHCQKLAPILDEVAASFKNDADVVIAKFDATANDILDDSFNVQGYPTLYFRSSKGNLLQFDGDRTKEEIIDFVQKNRDKAAEPDATAIKTDSAEADSTKDEL